MILFNCVDCFMIGKPRSRDSVKIGSMSDKEVRGGGEKRERMKMKTEELVLKRLTRSWMEVKILEVWE